MQKEVIIVGAGMAGMLTALSLNHYFGKVTVLEYHDKDNFFELLEKDTRTTALSYFTKNFLAECGLWQDKIDNIAGAISDIDIIDADFVSGDSWLDLHFAASDVVDDNPSPMGYIVRNDEFRKILLDEVRQHNNIEVIFDSKIMDIDYNEASLVLENGERINSSLIISTEGRGSLLLKESGIKISHKSYHQTAITFNIKHGNNHNCTAVERFMPTGPFAVLPMRDKHESSIVWTVESDAAEVYINLPKEEFLQAVYKRIGKRYTDIEVISPILTYPLSLNFTQQYYCGNVLFIGDVIHGMHPIAGQGYNQGVRDIAQLYSIIARNKRLGLDVSGATIADSYQKARLGDNIQMLTATDVFVKLFSNDNFALKHGRRIGIKAVDIIKPVKRFFIKQAMGKKNK